jgi:hypothetical protein
MHTASELNQLHKLGTFLNDYMRGGLLQYVSAIEVQIYMGCVKIDRPNARIREHEQQFSARPRVAFA